MKNLFVLFVMLLSLNLSFGQTENYRVQAEKMVEQLNNEITRSNPDVPLTVKQREDIISIEVDKRTQLQLIKRNVPTQSARRDRMRQAKKSAKKQIMDYVLTPEQKAARKKTLKGKNH